MVLLYCSDVLAIDGSQFPMLQRNPVYLHPKERKVEGKLWRGCEGIFWSLESLGTRKTLCVVGKLWFEEAFRGTLPSTLLDLFN